MSLAVSSAMCVEWIVEEERELSFGDVERICGEGGVERVDRGTEKEFWVQGKDDAVAVREDCGVEGCGGRGEVSGEEEEELGA